MANKGNFNENTRVQILSGTCAEYFTQLYQHAIVQGQGCE
jgi:hypothetical protein